MVIGDSKWFNEMDGEQAFPVLATRFEASSISATARSAD
jgi:hypothetical protein